MQNWLVIGATSGITIPLARELSLRQNRLCLVGRDQERLDRLAEDLRQRSGQDVRVYLLDVLDFEAHKPLLSMIDKEFGLLDGIVWSVGTMRDQFELQEDFESAHKEFNVNFTAALSFLNLVADLFEKRQSGHIVAIGSVAGDRGRKDNYIYGSSKAALHSLLQGLRQRLSSHNVKVLTVKPGPVRTKMTDGLGLQPLIAEPNDVARDIVKAIEKGKDVLYTPWYWRYILMVLRHIPEFIFKKLSLK